MKRRKRAVLASVDFNRMLAFDTRLNLAISKRWLNNPKMIEFGKKCVAKRV
jgi:hypothetical protein